MQKPVVNLETKQITYTDSRYYEKNGEYLPSVTTVLSGGSVTPEFLIEWFKITPKAEQDYILKKAGEQGTFVHETLENILHGEVVTFDNTDRYLWDMVVKGHEFLSLNKVKPLHIEMFLFAKNLGVAGTCDLIAEINGEIWLLDWKTSNNYSEKFNLQLYIYSKMIEECTGVKVDRAGVVWLKAKTRGAARKLGGSLNAPQGKGWQVKECDLNNEDYATEWNHIKWKYDKEFTDRNPKNWELPTELKMDWLK